MSEFNPTQSDYAKAEAAFDFLAGLIEAGALSARSAETGNALSVVLIGGFLGAGKTTLMRRILSTEEGRAITAVVNDVASLNIDAALIESVNGDTLTLSNGCVCCSAAGGVARVLATIASRASPPDAVLVEASGVGYPAALAQVVEAVDGVRVDACVSVLDADEWAHADGRARQMPMLDDADIVLLNKIDLVPQQSVESALATVAAEAPRACVIATVNCAVPVDLILSPGLRADTLGPPGVAALSTDYCVWTFDAPRPLDLPAIEALLGMLPPNIFRFKGFLPVTQATGVTLMLLQGVGRRWRWEEACSDEQGLVLIGQRAEAQDVAFLDQLEEVGLRLRSCVAA